MHINVIVGVIGGLGLFLFGIHILSDSLRTLSLGLLKNLLDKITSNKIKSALVGLGVTAIIQSSSATSVLIIGFLNAGFMQLSGAIAVMIGANIGTTVTAQLIAFKLTKSALVFVFIGSLVYLFAKKTKNKNRGLALLGFGILFLGLATMSSAVKPLADNEAMIDLLLRFGKHPLIGILTGLFVTVVLQSSSTVTGMIIAFASAGLLDLPSSLYLIFGTNIGTCVTAFIASIGGSLASKRLAVGNTLFNAAGVLIALPLVNLYLTYIPLTSPDIARQVANSHTVFNLINTVIFLPIVPLFVKILDKIMPGMDYEKTATRFLDKNLLVTPPLALRAVLKELSLMLSICQEMLEKARMCTIEYNHKLKNEITIDEESVDEMQKSITKYLVGITQNELTEKQQHLIPALLHSVNDIEKVGDFCESIVRLAQRAYEYDLVYSTAARSELDKLFDKTKILMHQTKKAMDNNDQVAATITLTIEQEIDELIRQYKINHLTRLEEGTCISEAGLVFSDILTDLGRLNDHLCNITKGVLHIGKR